MSGDVLDELINVTLQKSLFLTGLQVSWRKEWILFCGLKSQRVKLQKSNNTFDFIFTNKMFPIFKFVSSA